MKIVLRFVACLAAFAVSFLVAGFAIVALHLHPISTPAGMKPSAMLPAIVLASLVLVAGVAPLANGLRGAVGTRGAALFAFLLLALGINGTLETRAFSHMLDGALPAAMALGFAEALFLGGALGGSFGAEGEAPGLAFGSRLTRTGKVAIAWLAFPMIWWIFGMCVAPFVMPYYRAGAASLQIPPFGVMADTELLRSALFLLASLPLMSLWGGSRRGLWLALGLAHATVVGYFGLIQATFLPGILRIGHSLEITADSFVYAAVLVLLFAPRRVPTAAPVPASEVHA
jgi:hypothetical protein